MGSKLSRHRIISIFALLMLVVSISTLSYETVVASTYSGEYNVDGAVNYAEKYWDNWNDDYSIAPHHRINPLRSEESVLDCTNFVSQCLSVWWWTGARS